MLVLTNTPCCFKFGLNFHNMICWHTSKRGAKVFIVKAHHQLAFFMPIWLCTHTWWHRSLNCHWTLALNWARMFFKVLIQRYLQFANNALDMTLETITSWVLLQKSIYMHKPLMSWKRCCISSFWILGGNIHVGKSIYQVVFLIHQLQQLDVVPAAQSEHMHGANNSFLSIAPV